MKLITLTQHKSAVVDDDNYPIVSQYKWFAQRCESDRWYAVSRRVGSLHRFLMNSPKGMEVDHINGDGLDNRKSNLRICSHQENMKNRKIAKHNRTGYKGVTQKTYPSGTVRFRAHIRIDGRTKWLGYYLSPEDAYEVYVEAAARYHGQFAATYKQVA